jgi:hypothetical protein
MFDDWLFLYHVQFISDCRLVCKDWNEMILNMSNFWNQKEIRVNQGELRKISKQLTLGTLYEKIMNHSLFVVLER